VEQKYQVFISSTYVDLKDARKAVSEALLRAECFPAGMELFPSTDQEQFEFIKKIIDASDYYLIILAGRYGSINPETGLSYTEMEYDYAVSTGKPVIRLLHSNPLAGLDAKNIESSNMGKAKLLNFREKLSTGKLMRQWDSVDDLRFEVVMALQAAIRWNPCAGWTRGGQNSKELLEARKRISELEAELLSHKKSKNPIITEFLDQSFEHFFGEDAISRKQKFLIDIAKFMTNSVIFVNMLKDQISALSIGPRESSAFITAMELDGLIKIRTTGEVITLSAGDQLFRHAKLKGYLSNEV
jgi:hypothetical protein